MTEMTPYGIAMEALEGILELDVTGSRAFEEARTIASDAHSRAIGHWQRPAQPAPGDRAMTQPAPEVRTCYCGTTAVVVPEVFPHPDCDGSAPARPAGYVWDSDAGDARPVRYDGTAKTTPIQGKCRCPDGGQYVYWDAGRGIWCHTGGDACGVSAFRPPPDGAGQPLVFNPAVYNTERVLYILAWVVQERDAAFAELAALRTRKGH